MRYDADHKARTRHKVVRAASEAIRSEGPKGIGVADIMARAGLTHGGFYAHFGSKDALITAALDEAFSDSREVIARRSEGQTPREALRSYLRFYLSRSHRDARATGCPIAALAADMPRLGPLAKARFGEGVQALTARLAELMEAAGLPEPQTLAATTLAELQGALGLARAVADIEQSDAILVASRRSLMGRLGLKEAEAVQ